MNKCVVAFGQSKSYAKTSSGYKQACKTIFFIIEVRNSAASNEAVQLVYLPSL